MTGTQVFIGRRSALDVVREAIDEVSAGRGGLILISGEAGIGKTRLAEESVYLASAAGFDTSWATCFRAGGAPAFWPWIQLLRWQAERREPSELAGAVAHAVVLRSLVPELADRVPDRAPDALPSLDAQEERFKLFDEATSFFRRLAVTRPLLLVIDDLHEADPASALLLSFFVAGLPGNILVVATYRQPDAMSSPIGDVLRDLVKAARPIELKGLESDEVGELLSQTAGTSPDDDLVRAVFERSGGNPLFVRELARLLVAQGHMADRQASSSAVPTALLPVIERRTMMLSPPCRSMLQAAAVAGQDFRTLLVAELAEMSPDDASAAIDEALRMGIVVRLAGRRDQWCFVHGLVRDTVYQKTPPLRRSELHRQLASIIERRPDAERYLSELARHLTLSGTLTDLSLALGYSERAASAALDVLAYEEAEAQAERALDILERVDAADESRRCRLLRLLADAQDRSGRVGEARKTYLLAADAARRSGDAVELASAAVGYGSSDQYGAGVGVDTKNVTLAEDALSALGTNHEPLRLRLMTQLAFEVVYTDPQRFAQLATDIVESARRLNDPQLMTNALQLRHQLLFDGADHVPERLAIASELLRLGEEHRLTGAIAYGHIWRVYNLLMLGDIGGVDAEIAAMERLVEDARLPAYQWFPALWRAMRRLLEGRIDEAEMLAVRALEVGEARGQGAIDHLGMQLIAIRREQGRLGELTPIIRESAERYPEIPSYRCALAMAYAESGEEAAARIEFDRLAADDFTVIPRDYSWTICLLLLSETCAVLGDAERAAVLYDLFLPFDRRFVVVGYAGICSGAVSHQLGILAATAGRVDAAIRHLEAALREHRRVGAAAWIVRAQYELGRVLSRTDEERSRQLLRTASTTARELRLSTIGSRIDAMLPDVAPIAERAPNVFRREGDVWTLSFEGRSVYMKDAKGLHDIARLLATPGRELHALDLVAVAHVPAADRGRTDEVLDDRARAAYRARIEELREQIDDAELHNDPGHAEVAHAELEALTTQLASAYGLGGRRRRPGDPAERARKAVTERIRDSLRRISDVHPGLGRHLERSVNTGMFCSYTPDRPIRWDL